MFGVSDELLGTLVPITVFWAYCGVHKLAEKIGFLDGLRLHLKEEEDAKNIVSRAEVVRTVLLTQACQIAFALILLRIDVGESIRRSQVQQPPLLVAAAQIIVAALVFDTWQYFGHRFLHVNKFMYKHVHSKHHKVVVPYIYGAMYMHPVEIILGDIIGSTVAFYASGMTPRTAVFFFSMLMMKGVDDHSGMWLPLYHRLGWLAPNNPAFHDVHHQLYGLKYNFSSTFFTHWDRILGTYKPYALEKRPEGGWEIRPDQRQASQQKEAKEE